MIDSNINDIMVLYYLQIRKCYVYLAIKVFQLFYNRAFNCMTALMLLYINIEKDV